MSKVMFDLLLEAVRQIVERLDGIASVAVVGWYANNFVVHFAVVFEVEDTNNFSVNIHASLNTFFADHQRIELITVFIESLGNKAVVARLGKDTRFYTVEFKDCLLTVPLYFEH